MTLPHYDAQPERDESVIVEDRGSALGTVVGILVIAGLLLAIWFFALGPGSTVNTGDSDVNVNAPSNVVPPNPPAS